MLTHLPLPMRILFTLNIVAIATALICSISIETFLDGYGSQDLVFLICISFASSLFPCLAAVYFYNVKSFRGFFFPVMALSSVPTSLFVILINSYLVFATLNSHNLAGESALAFMMPLYSWYFTFWGVISGFVISTLIWFGRKALDPRPE